MLALLIILGIAFIFDLALLTWVFMNVRVMTSISPNAWYNAMYWGIGVALFFNLGYFIWLRVREVNSSIFLLLGSIGLFSLLSAIIAIVLSFFPTTWQSVHFVECVLSFVALTSPLLGILGLFFLKKE